jgi:WD40 repeat protein
MSSRCFALCLLALLWLPLTLYSQQQNCPLPPSLQPIPPGENIFSDAQEVDLGDAMAEVVSLHVNAIQNDELTAHLRDVGNRLVQHLPPTQLKFRFYLIDLPEVNAFSIAGGRVYVSRKVIAFSHNDDELAGILAHELGHIITHQIAIEMTRAFREVLGVTQVGDRDDVFKKFHQYMENAARHPRRGHGESEKEQLVADQISLFALARAGYSPQAFVDVWDRLNELHGRSGGWVSDLFNSTTPAQHRLRDMVQNMTSLPQGCAERASGPGDAVFQAWQETVVSYDDLQRPESLPGLISKHRLSARLRPDITNLRFSPDGKYILAQDDGGINVVSREPLAPVFYIPAPDAYPAHFSPDSSTLAFLTSGMRVELWSMGDHKRKSAHEISVRQPCIQTELSPDGGTLACLDSQYTLLLMDVATGSIIFEQKDFFHPDLYEMIRLLLAAEIVEQTGDESASQFFSLINMGFSRDGRYFLAAHGTPHLEYTFSGGGVEAGPAPEHLLFDVANRSKMPVPGAIQNLLGVSFTFLGTDRIVGINPLAPQKSHIVKFPSGEVVGDIQLWQGIKIRAAEHGDFLFVGPVNDYALGVMDIAAKENKIVIKQNAADMYDGVFVTEQINGQLALHSKASSQPLSTLMLPEASLGRVRAATVTPDLNYLAVSSRTRAAVWDIAQDFRAFQIRSFSAAGFDGPALYAHLPEVNGFPEQSVELHLDTGAHAFHELKDKDDDIAQHGIYMSVTKPRKRNGADWSNSDVEVQDVRSGKALWSHYFPKELPAITFLPEAGTVLLRWRLWESGGHNELQRFPAFQSVAEKDDYLCEVLDVNTGADIASFVLKTNKGSLQGVHGGANRNWAFIAAAGDQILTYALPSGELKGRFFGSYPMLSSSGLLAVDSEKREIALYDLATSQPNQQYVFAQPVAFKAFSGDGKRLLVFTSDQTVYILDVTAAPANLNPALTSNPAN